VKKVSLSRRVFLDSEISERKNTVFIDVNQRHAFSRREKIRFAQGKFSCKLDYNGAVTKLTAEGCFENFKATVAREGLFWGL
jgi:hypothetical protein